MKKNTDPGEEASAFRKQRAKEGGEARAKKLSPAKRKAIAKKAGKARWRNK